MPYTLQLFCRFTALDSRGGSSRVEAVKVVICEPCGDNGTCDFSQFHYQGNSTNFAVAECFCHDGWEGMMFSIKSIILHFYSI